MNRKVAGTGSRLGGSLSFAVLVLVTGAFGVVFFEVISVFLLPLFLATVVTVMLRPLQDQLQSLCGGRQYAAALLSSACVLLLLLLPTLTVFLIAGSEATQVVRRLDDGALQQKLQRARASLGLDYPFAAQLQFVDRSLDQMLLDARVGAGASGNPQALQNLRSEWEQLQDDLLEAGRGTGSASAQDCSAALADASAAAPGTLAYQLAVEKAVRHFHDFHDELLGGVWKTMLRELANPSSEDLRQWTVQFLALTPDRLSSLGSRASVLAARALFSVLIFLVAMYFFFADGARIGRSLTALSPLEERYVEQLADEFMRVTRAVVLGAVAAAAAQALLAGIAFRLAGMQSVFLLIALTAITAMIPFIGSAFVWMPVALWLIFIEQRLTAGTVLIVYGAGVISTIDNLIKPWVLHGRSAMHPLAALIGVLGGVQALGPLGVFVGPMVVAFLQTLLTLLHRELGSTAAVRRQPPAADTTPTGTTPAEPSDTKPTAAETPTATPPAASHS